MHIPDKRRGKLDPKAVEGFFVGLAENKRAYLIADSQNHLRLYESRNVLNELGSKSAKTTKMKTMDTSQTIQQDPSYPRNKLTLRSKSESKDKGRWEPVLKSKGERR